MPQNRLRPAWAACLSSSLPNSVLSSQSAASIRAALSAHRRFVLGDSHCGLFCTRMSFSSDEQHRESAVVATGFGHPWRRCSPRTSAHDPDAVATQRRRANIRVGRKPPTYGRISNSDPGDRLLVVGADYSLETSREFSCGPEPASKDRHLTGRSRLLTRGPATACNVRQGRPGLGYRSFFADRCRPKPSQRCPFGQDVRAEARVAVTTIALVNLVPFVESLGLAEGRRVRSPPRAAVFCSCGLRAESEDRMRRSCRSRPRSAIWCFSAGRRRPAGLMDPCGRRDKLTAALVCSAHTLVCLSARAVELPAR